MLINWQKQLAAKNEKGVRKGILPSKSRHESHTHKNVDKLSQCLLKICAYIEDQSRYTSLFVAMGPSRWVELCRDLSSNFIVDEVRRPRIDHYEITVRPFRNGWLMIKCDAKRTPGVQDVIVQSGKETPNEIVCVRLSTCTERLAKWIWMKMKCFILIQ